MDEHNSKFLPLILIPASITVIYSASKLLKSFKRFNTIIKNIDYHEIRKSINHLIDTIDLRNTY